MTDELPISLAVEKVLFRLALLEGGRVPIARAFVELPLALEVLELEADKCADGQAVVKDEFDEFLTYAFPELQAAAATLPPPPVDCPTCGRTPSPQVRVEGQPASPRCGIVCDTCYRTIRRLAQRTDESVADRVKQFFTGEEEQDFFKIALVEHEIFFIALRLGMRELTQTTITAQTRLPAVQVKERLDRLAGRRYIRQGLLPSGDALAFRFPQGMTYPEHLYKRILGAVVVNEDATPPSSRLGALAPKVRTAFGIKARPADTRTPDFPAPPPPAKPKLQIRITDRRDRNAPPRPPEGP